MIMIKNRIHALMAKNGVMHEFTDLFGVGGRIFLRLVVHKVYGK